MCRDLKKKETPLTSLQGLLASLWHQSLTFIPCTGAADLSGAVDGQDYIISSTAFFINAQSAELYKSALPQRTRVCKPRITPCRPLMSVANPVQVGNVPPPMV